MEVMDNKLESFFKSFAEADEELDFRFADQFGSKVPVVKTGSPGLDDALSSGGYPFGRIIQLYGPPHSGKTLMSMLAILEAQALNAESKQLFIDSEGTFSAIWAGTLGIDISRVLIVDGDSAVNGRRLFETLLGTPKEDSKHILVGKSKEGFLDKVADKTFDFNLVVLDSLGAIIPPGEDVSAVGKMNMSLLARFLSTTMKKLSLEVKKAKLPFIIINHKRDGMDPYGPDHTFSGGNTYGHFLSCNVYFEAIQRKDAQILNEKDQKIGHMIRAKVEKSKFGITPRQCEFKVDFSKGVVDKHEEIAKLALDYNVVEKPTSVSHQYGDYKWVGFPKFCEALFENPTLCKEIADKIEIARDSKFNRKPDSENVIEIKSEKKSKKVAV
jgi:recombination protein RecA